MTHEPAVATEQLRDAGVLHEERTDDERAMSKQALDKTHAIEQVYEDEDTVMMKRLIEIRGSLWT